MSTPDPASDDGRWQQPPEPPSPDAAAAEASRWRPPRLAWALVELVIAVLLVAAAFTAWDRAIVTIELPVRISATVTRYMGNWIALAVAAVTVAGLFMLDALRRVVIRWLLRQRASQPHHRLPAHGEA